LQGNILLIFNAHVSYAMSNLGLLYQKCFIVCIIVSAPGEYYVDLRYINPYIVLYCIQ